MTLISIIDGAVEERRRNEDQRRRNAIEKITLANVLGITETHGGSSSSSLQMSRTLLDIIRDENDEDHNNKANNWRSLKGCLRRRAGVPWTSSVHIPTSDVPTRSSSRISALHSSPNWANPSSESSSTHPLNSSPPKIPPNRRVQISRLSSTRFPTITFESPHLNSDESSHVSSNMSSQMNSDEPPYTESNGRTAVPGVEAPAPVKVSLMTLLEETDRQMGVVGPVYGENQVAGDEEEEEDEEMNDDEWEDRSSGDDHDGGDERRRGDFSCCVCMVKHKGAAFIPCGHTFCRLCSRELWVSRGNCPICNGFILEILNIF